MVGASSTHNWCCLCGALPVVSGQMRTAPTKQAMRALLHQCQAAVEVVARLEVQVEEQAQERRRRRREWRLKRFDQPIHMKHSSS